MPVVDELSEDDELLDTVYEAQGLASSAPPHSGSDADAGGSCVAHAYVELEKRRTPRHVFDEGPWLTGLRYCMTAMVLRLVKFARAVCSSN
jgi:hypothetical protein